MIVYPSDTRPMISLSSGSNPEILHTFRGKVSRARVELRKGILSVGCSDITVAAARFLLAEHEKHFPNVDESAFVIQTGDLP